MKNRTVIMKGLLVAVLLVIAGVWAARRADAIIIINSRGVDTGMFGITATQTARVHVLNADAEPTAHDLAVVDQALGDLSGHV